MLKVSIRTSGIYADEYQKQKFTFSSEPTKLTFAYHEEDGKIIIDTIHTNKLNNYERTIFRLTKLGYVFQDYALLPTLTAVENVCLPLLMQGIDEKEAITHGIVALERVGLTERVHHLPSQLSGGQQQRVSIARALAHLLLN